MKFYLKFWELLQILTTHFYLFNFYILLRFDFFLLFRTLFSLLFFLRDDGGFLWLSETVKSNWDKSDQTNKQH